MRTPLKNYPEAEQIIRIRRALALRKDGWAISQIERRLGHEWKAILVWAEKLNLIKCPRRLAPPPTQPNSTARKLEPKHSHDSPPLPDRSL